MSSAVKSKEYSHNDLIQDSESAESLLQYQSSKQTEARLKEHGEYRRYFSITAHWIAHVVLVVLAVLYVWQLVQYTAPTHSLCIHPTEAMYEDLPSYLEPEYRSMQPKTGPHHVKDTSWIGPTTKYNLELWQSITTIGVASITDDEQKKMMNMTTSRANSTGEFFIVPQVFHTLHCLKIMREAWWDHGLNITDREKRHLDHCVDNIRLNLMCTADLSPIPFHWGGDLHRPDYDTVRQCRRWDLIADWATRRNTTGYLM